MLFFFGRLRFIAAQYKDPLLVVESGIWAALIPSATNWGREVGLNSVCHCKALARGAIFTAGRGAAKHPPRSGAYQKQGACYSHVKTHLRG
jgi:hypothetical protein